MRISLLLTSLLLVTGQAACGDEKKRPLGDDCDQDSQCGEGLCLSNICLLPEGDNDTDTLINQTEHALGLNPLDADSDGDGIDDATEVGGDINNPIDTDGDGKIDAIESNVLDADKDCIPDQLDADDATPEADTAKRGLLMCRTSGVCATSGVRATCDDLVLNCDYREVTGYEATEVSCDGLDNDCNGQVDEPFAAGGALVTEGGPVLGETCGTGACANGTYVCDSNDVTKLACSTAGNVGVPTCGLDNDCDGVMDDGEDIAACVAFYADVDDDSFGAGTSRCLCGPDTTHTATEAGDCNDNDDQRYPGTVAICGVDANCDASLLDPGEICDDGNDSPLDGCDRCQPSPMQVGGPLTDATPVGLVGFVGGGWATFWRTWTWDGETGEERYDFEAFDDLGAMAGAFDTIGGNKSARVFGQAGEGFVVVWTGSVRDEATETWAYTLELQVFSGDGTPVSDMMTPVLWPEYSPSSLSFGSSPWLALPGGGGVLSIDIGYPGTNCEWGTCYEQQWIVFDEAFVPTSFRNDLPPGIDSWSSRLVVGESGEILTTITRQSQPTARLIPGFDVWKFDDTHPEGVIVFGINCTEWSCYEPALAAAGDGQYWIGFVRETVDPTSGIYQSDWVVGLYGSDGELVGALVEIPRDSQSMYSMSFVFNRSSSGGVWAFPDSSSNDRSVGGRIAKDGDVTPFRVDVDTLAARAITSGNKTLNYIPQSGFDRVVCDALADGGAACVGRLSRGEQVGEEWVWVYENWGFRYAADGGRRPFADPRSPSAR